MTEIEVAVIGGGVAGLASALALAERGMAVCLLEHHTAAVALPALGVPVEGPDGPADEAGGRRWARRCGRYQHVSG